MHMSQKKKDTVNPKVRVEGVDKKSSKEQFENVTDKKVDILTGDQPKADPQKKAAKGEGTVPVEGRIWVKMLRTKVKKRCANRRKSLTWRRSWKACSENRRNLTIVTCACTRSMIISGNDLERESRVDKKWGERVLIGIVSLVDDFERALESLQRAEDKEAVLEGIELIHSKFINFLKQHGVNEIEAVGQPFDADRFEAVITTPVEDEEQKGKVVDCIQKGYVLNEKIIRYPKVIVGE